MPERREEVTLVIDGERWANWRELEFKRTLDGFSTIGFAAPFESDRSEFRETFRPFQFRPLDVFVGGSSAADRVFHGTMVNIEPDSDAASHRVVVGAYSKPSVLVDCTPASASFPLELNGLDLVQICERLAAPFGIEVVQETDVGAVFRRVAIKPDEKIYGFLAKLAKERGVLIADNAQGQIVLRKATPAAVPVATIREGEPPLVDITSTFDPRSYFSEITGIAKTRTGRGGSAYTVKNDRLAGAATPVVRPVTVVLDDTDDADVPQATQARLGHMFGNALTVGLNGLPTWRTPEGELWAPDMALSLLAPSSMIYRETRFLVREVTLKQTEEKTTAALELALPEAFAGEVPAVLPWD